MNITSNIQCKICSTNNGFSSADRRSIIVMVVLTSIALAICYVSVLWYATRTRFKSKKTPDDIVYKNNAFNNEEELYEDYVQSIDNPKQATTTQGVRLEVENEFALL